MAGKMPSKPMKIGIGQATKAANRGPNPDDLTEGRMKVPGPARFVGTVSSSKGPIQPGDQRGAKPFHIMAKPLSTTKGEPAKEV